VLDLFSQSKLKLKSKRRNKIFVNQDQISKHRDHDFQLFNIRELFMIEKYFFLTLAVNCLGYIIFLTGSELIHLF